MGVFCKSSPCKVLAPKKASHLQYDSVGWQGSDWQAGVMVVAVGRRNQRVGVGTEWLPSKEMMLTAIISFCMGDETLSEYYTTVPARQKTHVQPWHKWQPEAAAWGWGCSHCGCSSYDGTCGTSSETCDQASDSCPVPHVLETTCSSHGTYLALTLLPAAPQPVDHSSSHHCGHHCSHSCGRSAMLRVQRGRSKKKRHAYLPLCMALAPTPELAWAAVSVCRAAKSHTKAQLSIQSRTGLPTPRALSPTDFL